MRLPAQPEMAGAGVFPRRQELAPMVSSGRPFYVLAFRLSLFFFKKKRGINLAYYSLRPQIFVALYFIVTLKNDKHLEIKK
jgi:hypothetical protein